MAQQVNLLFDLGEIVVTLLSFWISCSAYSSWGWLYRNYVRHPKSRIWMGWNELLYFASWWALIIAVISSLIPIINIAPVILVFICWLGDGGMDDAFRKHPFKKWSKHELEWEKGRMGKK